MSLYSSSDSEDSSSEDEEEYTASNNSARMILCHMDVDYFYAQCEEQELPKEQRNRPIAVGQKHIIVTCNYVARAHGVSKLMLQSSAKMACVRIYS